MLLRWRVPVQIRRRRGFSTTTISHAAAAAAAAPRLAALKTESDHAAARRWLDDFTLGDIPKHAYEVGYSRSSGPGGQHVNKTNSKATVRCDLRGEWIPPFVLPPLTRSAYYLPNPPSLLVSSQLTRTASANLAAALEILHSTILSAGRSVVQGQTAPEQKQKVQDLVRAEKARTRAGKEKRSVKKASRKDFG